MWLFHCHIGWHMEMGMALVFDESSELVSPPPSDYEVCGAASALGGLSAFTEETVKIVSNTTTNTIIVDDNDDEFTHGSAFQVLISFVVVLACIAAVALFAVWVSRRKVNGMFVTVDNAAQESSTTTNPISRHAVHEGLGEMESGGSNSSIEMTHVGGNTAAYGTKFPPSPVRPASSARINPITGHAHTHHEASRRASASQSGLSVERPAEEDGELSYEDSVDQFEEVSFVAAARSAMLKHKNSPQRGGEYDSFEDSDEHGVHGQGQGQGTSRGGGSARPGNAFRSVRQSLTWKTSPGLN